MPSSSEGKRVWPPSFWAATWSTETPTRMFGAVGLEGVDAGEEAGERAGVVAGAVALGVGVVLGQAA